ncbi:hypothetical protein [Streptosporangium sp. LJ11]|uniref:hypothetical protein n=1 Tax=Streptosporangium sp. LJ11 TaxID=3436927 RepID=UPI003F7A17BA
MFDLDQVRLILFLLLLMIVGFGIRHWRARSNVVRVHIDLGLVTPVGVQVRAHDLIEAGRFTDAIELIRKESQVSQDEAEDVAKTLRAGHVLPDFPMPWEGDLPTRVRNLVSAGRRKEAVFLVRSKEGMSQPKAEAFVDSLPSEPSAPAGGCVSSRHNGLLRHYQGDEQHEGCEESEDDA